jgi:hypothetical protein
LSRSFSVVLLLMIDVRLCHHETLPTSSSILDLPYHDTPVEDLVSTPCIYFHITTAIGQTRAVVLRSLDSRALKLHLLSRRRYARRLRLALPGSTTAAQFHRGCTFRDRLVQQGSALSSSIAFSLFRSNTR